jgi:hypothetical protein
VASNNGGHKTVRVAKTKGGSFGILIALLPVSFGNKAIKLLRCFAHARELLERDPDYFCQSAIEATIPAASQPKEKNMSKPTHIAYVVNKRNDDEDKKDWRRVGAVWPHKKGSGFDLVIYPQVSVSGRIVCTVPKDDEEPAEETAPATE